MELFIVGARSVLHDSEYDVPQQHKNFPWYEMCAGIAYTIPFLSADPVVSTFAIHRLNDKFCRKFLQKCFGYRNVQFLHIEIVNKLKTSLLKTISVRLLKMSNDRHNSQCIAKASFTMLRKFEIWLSTLTNLSITVHTLANLFWTKFSDELSQYGQSLLTCKLLFICFQNWLIYCQNTKGYQFNWDSSVIM